MPRYKIPVQEEIRVWQHIDLFIETDDDLKTVYEAMLNGELINKYSSYDSTVVETMWETCETLEYDYGYTREADIEEIDYGNE